MALPLAGLPGGVPARAALLQLEANLSHVTFAVAAQKHLNLAKTRTLALDNRDSTVKVTGTVLTVTGTAAY